MEREEIACSVFLNYIRRDNFKSGLLSCRFLTPLNRTTASYNTLLNGVLLRGSAKYPDMQVLSSYTDDLYGTQISCACRNYGEIHSMGFTAAFLDEKYLPSPANLTEKVIDLIGELLLNPLLNEGDFSEEYVETEKNNLLESIRSVVNDKEEYASIRLRQIMCAGEPYETDPWGEESVVSGIDRFSLTGYYRDLIAHSWLEIFYCGSMSYEVIKSAACSVFRNLPREGIRSLEKCVKVKEAPPSRIVTESADLTQAKLEIGFRCLSDDEYALMIVNSMLGGCSTSKLFTRIRDQLGLCYYISSNYIRSKGILTVSSGINPEDFDKVRLEIIRQLEEIQKGNWSENERKSAVTSILTDIRVINDSLFSLENFHTTAAILSYKDHPEEMIQHLTGVSAERIRKAADSIKADLVYLLKDYGGEPE